MRLESLARIWTVPIDYDDMRASPAVLSQYGTRTALSLLLPLQVAAKLGDKKLVRDASAACEAPAHVSACKAWHTRKRSRRAAARARDKCPPSRPFAEAAAVAVHPH